MAKNNIRSVRFSDEMIEIINQQVGENFTQKFERMVYNCYMLLPEGEGAAGRTAGYAHQRQAESAEQATGSLLRSHAVHQLTGSPAARPEPAV